MTKFNNWADEIQRIRDHTRDGHHLHTVVQVKASQIMAGVHLSVNDPGATDLPICGSFDHYETQAWTEPADCVVCLALAREAQGIDTRDLPMPALGRDVWKLKTFDNRKQEWKTKRVGGEDQLSLMLTEMFRWKAEGQQVRLEWSELN